MTLRNCMVARDELTFHALAFAPYFCIDRKAKICILKHLVAFEEKKIVFTIPHVHFLKSEELGTDTPIL